MEDHIYLLRKGRHSALDELGCSAGLSHSDIRRQVLQLLHHQAPHFTEVLGIRLHRPRSTGSPRSALLRLPHIDHPADLACALPAGEGGELQPRVPQPNQWGHHSHRPQQCNQHQRDSVLTLLRELLLPLRHHLPQRPRAADHPAGLLRSLPHPRLQDQPLHHEVKEGSGSEGMPAQGRYNRSDGAARKNLIEPEYGAGLEEHLRVQVNGTIYRELFLSGPQLCLALLLSCFGRCE